MYAKRGEPVLALEFDVFAHDNKVSVSMWAHTRHNIPFTEMKAAFEAIVGHLLSFIDDGDMCPFNPAFRDKADRTEGEERV